MSKRIGKGLGWVISLLLGSALLPARAQAPTLQATVDRTSVALGEALTLTVSATGVTAVQAAPVLPDLPDFEVTPAGTFNNVSVVNGQMSATISWNYQLFPKRTGRFTIGAITLRVGSRTLRSQPLQVTVTEAGGQEAPAGKEREPFFVEATVDPRRPFVNQQVTLTVTAYSQYQTFQVEFAEPEFSGFRIYPLSPSPGRVEQVGGRPYLVERRSYVLFPLRSGKLTIPSVPVRFELDFFNQKEVRSRPLSLDVQPLPRSNVPPDFQGAVGQFRLSARVDKATVPAGEPLTLSAEVAGTGDFQTVPPLKLPELPGFQRFEPSQKEEKPQWVKGQVTGRKTMEVVLVPQKPGSYVLGPLRLCYFDPRLGQYRRATSQALRVTVTPGPAGPVPAGGGFAPERVRIVRRDIRYLKPDLAQVRDEKGLALLRPLSLGLHAAPLLAWLTLAGIKRRQALLAADTPYARAVQASRAARKWLRQAADLLQPEHSAEFHAAVARGLTEYLALQIGAPAPSISSETVGDWIADFCARSGAASPPPELTASLRDCLARCEFARFSGTAMTEAEMQATLAQAQRIITEWERSRRR
jgi:hypothetical protein